MATMIEDQSVDIATRATAAHELRPIATEACLPGLLRLIPGDWDLLTFRVLRFAPPIHPAGGTGTGTSAAL